MRVTASENSGFLITTGSFEVAESWTPEPGAVQVGAIVKRKIIQRASQLSGIVLAPAPASFPDGIKVYLGDAIIEDKIERGNLTGARTDTLTYQMKKAGSLTLPQLSYMWWNPKTERMEKTILPAAIFTVSPAPSIASKSPAGNQFSVGIYWIIFVVCVVIFGLFAIWQRKMLRSRLQELWKVLHPADKVLARRLLQACRNNNGAAAGELWISWRNTQESSFRPSPELQKSVLVLQRYLFGPEPDNMWQGEELARTFRQYINNSKEKNPLKKPVLPELNG